MGFNPIKKVKRAVNDAVDEFEGVVDDIGDGISDEVRDRVKDAARKGVNDVVSDMKFKLILGAAVAGVVLVAVILGFSGWL